MLIFRKFLRTYQVSRYSLQKMMFQRSVIKQMLLKKPYSLKLTFFLT